PLRGADDGEGRRARRRRAGGGPAADGRGAAGTAGGRPRPGAEAATPREGEGRAARRRRLLALPFAEFTARDVAEARDLVRELGRRLRGRLARRLRRARRGPVDFRRTIRASLATGGTPL